MTSSIRDSSVLSSLEKMDWEPMAAAPSSQDELVTPSMTAGQVFRGQSSITSLAAPMDTSESAAHPQPRTYLTSEPKVPGLILAPATMEAIPRIEGLKNLLTSIGVWDRLGGKIQLAHNGLPCIVFSRDAREELSALSHSHRQLAQFVRNQNSLTCFYRFHPARPDGPVPSMRGLIETTESESLYKKSIQEFTASAYAFCQKMGEPAPVECTLDLKRIGQSQIALLLEILHSQNHRGICIGENHLEINPKKFLIDNMKALAGMDIDTLFIENIPYEFAQPLLDVYFHPDCQEMPLPLRNYLATLDRGLPEKYNYTALIRAAKQAGIRVVSLDTSLSRQTGNPALYRQNTADVNRIAAGNLAGFNIVKHEKGKGKYILLSGLFHGTTIKIGHTTIPGLSDLLQIPLIAIRDSQKTQDLINVKNLKFGNVPMKNIHLYSSAPSPQAPPPQISATPSPSASSSSSSSSGSGSASSGSTPMDTSTS